MQFMLEEECYHDDPKIKYFAIGHGSTNLEYLEEDEEPEDFQVRVFVKGTPIGGVVHDDDENVVFDRRLYRRRVHEQVDLIAWFYYKHFAFKHLVDILKKLKVQTKLLEKLGLINFDLLIAESEKLRDEYLAKHHSLIESNKYDFKVETEIYSDYGDLEPEEEIKLILEAEFDEDKSEFTIRTYYDSYTSDFTDLREDLKSLHEPLYKDLFTDYCIAMGTLVFIYEGILREFFLEKDMKDSNNEEYEKLFNVYWKELDSLHK